MKEERKQKRHRDRPLYVPPIFRRGAETRVTVKQEERLNEERKHPDLVSALKHVELIGKFGRIGDYEFEYAKREDAEHAANLLQIPGRYEECGLVEHVEPLSNISRNRLSDDDNEKNFSKTLRSDSSIAHRPRSKYNRLIDNVDLIIPENKTWNYGRNNNNTKKKQVSFSKVRTLHRQQQPVKLIDKRKVDTLALERTNNNNSNDNTASSNNSITGSSNKQMVSNGNTKKMVTTNVKLTKPMDTQEFSVYTFEYEIFNRFPESICRRLINALWIRLFYSRIKECQSNESALDGLPEIINISLKYFNFIVKVIQQHSATLFKNAEALHCLSCVYIIIGDIARYRDMHQLHLLREKFNQQLCSEDEFLELKSKLFLEAKQLYKHAQRCFPQEGHIYSQFGYISGYADDVLERVMYTLRSCISTFNYRNQDTLTMLLATGFNSVESTNISSSQSNLHKCCRIFLSLIQSLYSKIRLEQFDHDLGLLNDTLESVLKSQLASFVVNQLTIVVCITMMIMVETSNLWEAQQYRIGHEVMQKLNQVNLVTTTKTITSNDEERECDVFEISDSTYSVTKLEIQELYKQIDLDFSSVFESINVDVLTGLIEKNERFRLSCILLCVIGNRLILNADSPVSALWEVLSLILLWMMHLKLFQVNTGLLVPHVCKLRDLLLDRLSEFEQDFDSKNLLVSALGYALPEDDWLIGFIKLPLSFEGYGCLPFERRNVIYVTRRSTEKTNDSIFSTLRRRSKSLDLTPNVGVDDEQNKRTDDDAFFQKFNNLTDKDESNSSHVMKRSKSASYDDDSTSFLKKFSSSKNTLIEAVLPVSFSSNETTTPYSLIRLARFFVYSWSIFAQSEQQQVDSLNSNEIKEMFLEETGSATTKVQKKGLILLQEPLHLKNSLKKTKKSQSKHRDRNKHFAESKTSRSRSTFDSSPHKSKEDDNNATSVSSLVLSNKPLPNQHIVIDGRSVGAWHQLPKESVVKQKSLHCSIEGIDVTVEYYLLNQCQVLVFLPDYIVERELQKEKSSELAGTNKVSSIITKLEDKKILATVPSQDPEWPYIVETAYRLNSCVVSNRNLQEMYEELQGEQREIMRCLKVKIISFTFVDNEFLPNPDFIFPI